MASSTRRSIAVNRAFSTLEDFSARKARFSYATKEADNGGAGKRVDELSGAAGTVLALRASPRSRSPADRRQSGDHILVTDASISLSHLLRYGFDRMGVETSYYDPPSALRSNP